MCEVSVDFYKAGVNVSLSQMEVFLESSTPAFRIPVSVDFYKAGVNVSLSQMEVFLESSTPAFRVFREGAKPPQNL